LCISSATTTQTLNKKDTKLYAPLSNVGLVSFDKDAVYIDIGKVNYTKKKDLDLPRNENGQDNPEEEEESSDDEYHSDAPAGLLKSLQDVTGVDEKMKYSTLKLFKGSKAVKAKNEEEEEQDNNAKNSKRRPVDDVYELANSFRRRFDGMDEDDDGEEGSGSESGSGSDSDQDDKSVGSISGAEIEQDGNVSNDDSGSDSDSGSDDELKEGQKETWRTSIAQQAAMNYLRRERSVTNLQQLVYGTVTKGSNFVSEDDGSASENEDSDDESSDEEFFKLRDKNAQKADAKKATDGTDSLDQIELGENDSSRTLLHGDSTGFAFDMNAWLQEGGDCLIERIRDRFVTGNWGSGDNNGEEFDDFEDIENGERYGESKL
jgi:ribosome biogenesis protein BMS1